LIGGPARFERHPQRPIKVFGLSLASAVFLDTFVVRSLLPPAVLELLGRWTWALPASLERRLDFQPGRWRAARYFPRRTAFTAGPAGSKFGRRPWQISVMA
jgi:hypothetical protein